MTLGGAAAAGAPFSRAGFAKMVERTGKAAGFAFPAHFHMLRHACGYFFANRGEDTRSLQLWLGHKAIQHTVKHTQLSAERFQFAARLLDAGRHDQWIILSGRPWRTKRRVSTGKPNT